MTTPKEALEQIANTFDHESYPTIGSKERRAGDLAREALASLQGEDAVERVARAVVAWADVEELEFTIRQIDSLVRTILATSLVPAAARADAIDPADLWGRYCDETDEEFRTPQGAVAFAVAAIRSGGVK